MNAAFGGAPPRPGRLRFCRQVLHVVKRRHDAPRSEYAQNRLAQHGVFPGFERITFRLRVPKYTSSIALKTLRRIFVPQRASFKPMARKMFMACRQLVKTDCSRLSLANAIAGRRQQILQKRLLCFVELAFLLLPGKVAAKSRPRSRFEGPGDPGRRTPGNA